MHWSRLSITFLLTSTCLAAQAKPRCDGKHLCTSLHHQQSQNLFSRPIDFHFLTMCEEGIDTTKLPTPPEFQSQGAAPVSEPNTILQISPLVLSGVPCLQGPVSLKNTFR